MSKPGEEAPLPQAATGRLIKARAQSPQPLVSPRAVFLFRRVLKNIRRRTRSDRSSISSSRRCASFQRRRRRRQLLLWWDGCRSRCFERLEELALPRWSGR